MTQKFLISFGTEGGELVANLTDIDEKGVLEKLTREDARSPLYNRRLHALSTYRFRVLANSHRHIETYIVNLDETFTEDDVWVWFEKDPQGLMDLLRKRGKLLTDLSCPANFEWTYKPK